MSSIDEIISGKEVRLFPSHHITSIREAELRATASCLAVACAVSEFGRAVVSMAGGPRGRLQCYTEVSFKVRDGMKFREERPDGVLRVTRGKTSWTALVEVKVGDNSLEQEQFDRYHALARDEGFDALITISNQSALANGLPPRLTVDGRRLRSVPVVHLSWERLFSEAQLLSRRKEVEDPDQRWMLEEWIRYIDDSQSRIIEPPQMGDHWKEILRGAREGNLASCTDQMRDVVHRWDAFLKKVALRLRARLGVEVTVKTSRAERNDPALRHKNLHAAAIKDGVLSGVLRVPDAAGDLKVDVLLASRCVQYSIDVDAPTEGRTKTRINWLLRQIVSPKTPGELVVRVQWDRRDAWSQGRIKELQVDTDILLRDNNGQTMPREASPRSFSLDWTTGLPKGKGRSTAPVLEGIAHGVVEFYKGVVEDLRPYVPRAPQLPEDQPESETTPSPPAAGPQDGHRTPSQAPEAAVVEKEPQPEKVLIDEATNLSPRDPNRKK